MAVFSPATLIVTSHVHCDAATCSVTTTLPQSESVLVDVEGCKAGTSEQQKVVPGSRASTEKC